MKKLLLFIFIFIFNFAIRSAEVAQKLTLITKDNKKIVVDRNLYKQYSDLIKTALEDDPNEKEIRISYVDSRNIKIIQDFLSSGLL